MAVTIKEEYLLKTFLEIIAPVTQETAASKIKVFPIIICGEKLPVKNCGIPIIVTVPKSPKTIPKIFAR